MVKITGKVSIRGGPLLNAGDCYTGPHEDWLILNQLGELMEQPSTGGPQHKAPSSPPQDKMIKGDKTWKKSSN